MIALSEPCQADAVLVGEGHALWLYSPRLHRGVNDRRRSLSRCCLEE